MAFPVYAVIVTHDSADILTTCLAHLENQTTPLENIIIVDSGSESKDYLRAIKTGKGVRIIAGDNVGYARANNIGYREIEKSEGMVIFMNPDTFLPPDYIALAVKILAENSSAAIISGKLRGFDLKKMADTGRIDSTGIFRKWYGRWYDRGQGSADTGQYDKKCMPPAVCGALMCCNILALQSFNGEVFDGDFFLYKEDIELSLRLRKKGWKLLYDPQLVAFHCRGWQRKRSGISQAMRIVAAESEMLLYRKHPSPYMIWAFLKWSAVKLLRI